MPQPSITSWFKKQSVASKSSRKQNNSNLVESLPEEASSSGSKTEQDIGISSNTESTFTSHHSPTLSCSKENLPQNVHINSVSDSTLPEFRRLVQLLLQIPYPDKFYKEIISDPVTASITLAAFWHGDAGSKSQLVAGIRCKLLAKPLYRTDVGGGDKPSLYIATICTLAPYRGHGLAPALLNRVTASAIEDYGIGAVTAHVWEASVEAKAWYEKLGFQPILYEPKYYRRLTPSGAYLMERKVRPTDLLRSRELNFDG
jgi:ribosomal protein S18 acetylase RimI-like enzyme